MRGEAVAGISGHTLKLTVAGCGLGAVLAIAGGLLTGAWPVGLGLAAGLLLGSVNGYAARRSLSVEAEFRTLSLLRLAVLTAAGIGTGLALGAVVPVVLGLGLAQLALAASAFKEALRV